MNKKLEQIIYNSRIAESDKDWSSIDTQIRQLPNPLSPRDIRELLTCVNDDDSRVRDAIATILGETQVVDKKLLDEVVHLMISQATEDLDIFASGRAASFLLKHQNNEFSKNLITGALDTFKSRAMANAWIDELISNIPNESLKSLLI